MRINLNSDGIGFVEKHDFSTANMSMKKRIEFVTRVASICYQSKNTIGSEVLYNRLARESAGLPSSSFEFIPVLLDLDRPSDRALLTLDDTPITKYGEYITEKKYLTNYRALMNTHNLFKDLFTFSILDIFNTSDEDIELIRENFKVFLFKTDLSTRTQSIRHRVMWQELSRRYVDGNKYLIEFLLTNDIVESDVTTDGYSTDELFDLLNRHYNDLRETGVKPESARRVLPQAMYTLYWGAFLPSYYKNFINLRTHKTAQTQIRDTAKAMEELCKM